MCAPTPDTGGINNAALLSANTGKDALDWFKGVYADQAPQRNAAAALDQQVGQQQLASMQFATDQAQKAATRNETVVQPMEDKIFADAQGYDTPERRAAAGAEAQASVEGNFGRAQEGVTREIMRRGGTMGDASSSALMQDAALEKAKAITGATAGATRNVEAQGHARMMDAAGLGHGVVGNQATQQQVATNAGTAATGAAGAGLAATMSGNSTMGQGFTTALQGYGQMGNLFGQAAGVQSQTRGQDLNFYSKAMESATKVYGMSSKKLKKNTGKTADGGAALDQIDALDVKDGWQYDPAKGGPDDGGVPHTGPMAEDVQATMGNKMAPGGKMIDLVGMSGKLIASMQELSKRVKKLETTETAEA